MKSGLLYNQITPPESDTAFVVFSGQADLKWLRPLKAGFRHCFLILHTNGHWVFYNPLSHKTEIGPIHFQALGPFLCNCLQSGNTIVKTSTRPAPMKMAPWRPYTCVEAIKRIIGLHTPYIFTPWQLFRYLKNKY